MTEKRFELNGRFLHSNHPTGTHRSAEKFAQALLVAANGENIDCVLHVNDHWERGKRFMDENSPEVKLHQINSRVGIHAWEQLKFPLESRYGVGINFLGTAPGFGIGGTQAMFVHDLHSMLAPELFSPQYRVWAKFCKYRAIKQAKVLITVSDFVRQQLVDLLGVPYEKTMVVHQGPGASAFESVESNVGLGERKHFLCVGSLQPHKNLKRILKAWKLSGANKLFELVVVGKRQENFKYELDDDDDDGTSGVRFTGYVDDSELVDLYKNARGLIFPSMMEGYGLPIVEAFFTGTPVITSNTTAMPEVVGDAGIKVNPNDVVEIANAIKLLSERDEIAIDLSEQGWIRKEQFRWKISGKKLFDGLCNHLGWR